MTDTEKQEVERLVNELKSLPGIADVTVFTWEELENFLIKEIQLGVH